MGLGPPYLWRGKQTLPERYKRTPREHRRHPEDSVSLELVLEPPAQISESPLFTAEEGVPHAVERPSRTWHVHAPANAIRVPREPLGRPEGAVSRLCASTEDQVGQSGASS